MSSIDKIIDNLYLGDIRSAQNIQTLRSKGITHILQALGGFAPSFPSQFQYKVLQIMDVPWENLGRHFMDCVHFIKRAIQSGGTVLVHCWAGISRSASCIIAYLMYEHELPLQEALFLTKRCRNIINPNPGFRKQLLEFEKKLKQIRIEQKIHQQQLENKFVNQNFYQLNISENIYQSRNSQQNRSLIIQGQNNISMKKNQNLREQQINIDMNKYQQELEKDQKQYMIQKLDSKNTSLQPFLRNDFNLMSQIDRTSINVKKLNRTVIKGALNNKINNIQKDGNVENSLNKIRRSASAEESIIQQKTQTNSQYYQQKLKNNKKMQEKQNFQTHIQDSKNKLKLNEALQNFRYSIKSHSNLSKQKPQDNHQQIIKGQMFNTDIQLKKKSQLISQTASQSNEQIKQKEILNFLPLSPYAGRHQPQSSTYGNLYQDSKINLSQSLSIKKQQPQQNQRNVLSSQTFKKQKIVNGPTVLDILQFQAKKFDKNNRNNQQKKLVSASVSKNVPFTSQNEVERIVVFQNKNIREMQTKNQNKTVLQSGRIHIPIFLQI